METDTNRTENISITPPVEKGRVDESPQGMEDRLAAASTPDTAQGTDTSAVSNKDQSPSTEGETTTNTRLSMDKEGTNETKPKVHPFFGTCVCFNN